MPLQSFDAKLRTAGSNWQPILACEHRCATVPQMDHVALRFADHGRLVIGISASQLDVWSASTGTHCGTYKATRSGDWIFVGPGNGPLNERSLEFLPHKNALNSMMCVVGEEWFPWDLCEAAFADKWLNSRGLPASLTDN